MASVIFSNAQRIIAQIFDWLQSSGQTRTAELIMDTFSAGIDNATTSGEGFLVVPGTNNTSANPSVNVTLGGIAYDPAANRIFISPTDTTLYNAANVSDTTNDGLGNLLPTPQSTGVINVPMTQTSLNYIWIDYLPTINTAAFTLNEETNAKIFYEQTDGYNIQVTTVNIPPDANSIFLASVDMTGGGAVASSNISQVGRSYYQVLPNIVPITTVLADKSDRTTTYNYASTYTLETHIKAVGTGDMSPTNPHATSLEDLGVSVLDTVQEHRLLEHGGGGGSSIAANAVIAGVPGTPYPTVSGLAPSVNIVNPGSDSLNVFALASNEYVIVDGSAFNASNIPAFATNSTVLFPSISGTYNVYWDAGVKAFGVTTADITNDITKIFLATVTYTYVGTGPLDHNALSGLIDRRRVGSTTHLLQRWTNNSRPGAGSSLQPQSGEYGFNLISGALEYWDGTTWQQPVTVASFTTVPTGSLLPFAGFVAPSGFLLANGGSYLTTAFPALFAVIGYTYGGSGGNFNVPNMVNNIPVGAGGSIAPSVGSTSGSATHTLSVSELPTGIPVSISDPGHAHGISDPSHNHGTQSQGGIAAGAPNIVLKNDLLTSPTSHTFNATTGISVNSNTTGISASANGSNSAHSIVQPSVGVNYIIKI